MRAENSVILTADGTPVDVANAQCTQCQQIGTLSLDIRMEVQQPGTYSLAGVMPKVAAREVAYLVCSACGAQCRGKR